MKVSELELFAVPPRWLFLKISTDEGITGWGEPIVEGRAATVAAAVRELGEMVVGRDPRHIEDIWSTLYRGGFYRGGPILSSAMSGIEQALWDIKGRALDSPVYELLGGPVRDRMRMYGWVGGTDADALGAACRARVDAGYTAVKLEVPGPMEWIETPARVDEIVAWLEAVRDAVGPHVDVALDLHGRLHLPMARRLLRALEPIGLLFAEEPLLPEHAHALPELRRSTTTPIAVGERVYTRWGFRDLLVSGAVDIVQPDVSHAGGIGETRKIAAMAEAFDVALAIHCPLGPIALAASLQVDFCSPNAVIQEQSFGIHYNQPGADLFEYVVDPAPLQHGDGWVQRPTGPGLGVTIDEERVRHAAEGGHAWRNPLWRTSDGSVAEW